MTGKETIGRVHSIQSLGTVDGPGVRFVVFLSGCNLRCKCCHNPDTWDMGGGKLYSAEEIVKKCIRYKDYFGEAGGITLSGGEPLLQAEFAKEIFRLAKESGINTCLDTSGSLWSEKIEELLSYTDRVLLDVKYTSDGLYRENVGCGIAPVLNFLARLSEMKIKTTLRQVIIPSVNDNRESILFLKSLKEKHRAVDKIELLPFRKICTSKYEEMNIPFPFGDIPEATDDIIQALGKFLN